MLMKPSVMGILNITPDSFSDGGELFHHQKPHYEHALKRALQMQADGAAIIDVGGESTRPGAARVSIQEELDRVIPVIEAIVRESPVLVSVDTSKPLVMQEAIRAGARFINDVCALQQPDSMAVVSRAVATGSDLQVCLMHMQGQPQTMQQAPVYADVVGEVHAFLEGRIIACERAGLSRSRLWIDPGFGFGKTLDHNLSLVKHLSCFSDLGCPVLAGVSRKSMIGKLTGRFEVKERLAGSLALAWACLQQGAKMLRVHDVKETVDLVKIYQAIQEAQ